jgi:hypothetical protein
VGTLSALMVYAGGALVAVRVIRKLRRRPDQTVFDRVAVLIASYCIAKPVYFLAINGNSMVAMQEFVLPIALLLCCERLIDQRGATDAPRVEGVSG